MHPTPAAQHPTVLYVEDEEFDVFFMRRAFQRSGAQCGLQVVENGQLAIDYLSGATPFDNRAQYPIPGLLVLDLNLPGLSGFDVLNYLRQHPEILAPPVVVFSSSARFEDRTKALAMGAADYVEKPSSGLEFAEVVMSLRRRWLAKA
jgi:CheY-like chemotaxis protein